MSQVSTAPSPSELAGLRQFATSPSKPGLAAARTVCTTPAETLPRKFVSPSYDAVIVFVPVVVDVRLQVPAATGAKQIFVPSKTVTVPVGVPAGGFVVTVAVNVTFWPNTDGFTDEVTVGSGCSIPVILIVWWLVDVNVPLPLISSVRFGLLTPAVLMLRISPNTLGGPPLTLKVTFGLAFGAGETLNVSLPFCPLNVFVELEPRPVPVTLNVSAPSPPFMVVKAPVAFTL